MYKTSIIQNDEGNYQCAVRLCREVLYLGPVRAHYVSAERDMYQFLFYAPMTSKEKLILQRRPRKAA